MAARINMADADFEPTDEQLGQLVREAFAGVKAANDQALVRFWAEIAVATERATPAPQGGSDPSSRP